MHIKNAVDNATKDLLDINSSISEIKVCIIDTCNEHESGNKYLNIDFTGWKKIIVWPNLDKNNMEGYLAWTLRNVLRRKIPGPSDNYYLNPEKAGYQVCINVHKKKNRALFGKKIMNSFSINSTSSTDPTSTMEAISMLNERADSYESYLQTNMQLDNEIEKIISKIIT